MSVVFNGDFSTGNISQYTAVGGGLTTPTSGTVTVATSATLGGVTYTPESGGCLFVTQNPNVAPGGSHAEAAFLFNGLNGTLDFSSYYNQTFYYTISFLIDPANAWTVGHPFDSATNQRTHWTMCQWLGRNLQGSSLSLVMRPAGWNSVSDLCVTLTASGGLTVPGSSIEQLVILDETAGNGWNTLVSPGTQRAAQRWPQVMGPNVYGTGGGNTNIPVTKGEWHDLIVEIKQSTDLGIGYHKVLYQKRGSGVTWQTAFDTSSNPNWKTVQYNPSQGQPAATGGSNPRHSWGSYTYFTDETFKVLLTMGGIYTTLAEAKAKFAVEGGAPTHTQVQGSRMTVKVNV